MKKYLIGIKIFGWIEIVSILTIFFVLSDIKKYPQMLFIWSPVVAIIGSLTIKLKPMARSFNIFLSPLIVIVYSCGFFMIFERVTWVHLNVTDFYLFSGMALIIHIVFFTRRAVRNIFNEE